MKKGTRKVIYVMVEPELFMEFKIEMVNKSLSVKELFMICWEDYKKKQKEKEDEERIEKMFEELDDTILS